MAIIYGIGDSNFINISLLDRLPSGTSLPELTLGQTLTGRVISWTEPDMAQLELDGKPVLAQSTIYLRPGDNVAVKVDQLSPQVILSLVKNPHDLSMEKSLSLIRSYLPGRIPLGEVISNLQDLLQNALFQKRKDDFSNIIARLRSIISTLILNPEKIEENPLKQLIIGLGLNQEAKLKRLTENQKSAEGKVSEKTDTLKGLLLEFLTKLKNFQEQGRGFNFNGSGPSNFEELKGTLENSVRQVELNQLMNVHTWKEEGSFFVQVPFSAESSIKTALMVFRHNFGQGSQGASQTGYYSVSIYVEMQNLGELKVEAGLRGKDLSCVLLTERSEVADFINNHLPELESEINKLGYNVIGLKARQASGNFSPESHLGLAFKNARLLDLRV